MPLFSSRIRVMSPSPSLRAHPIVARRKAMNKNSKSGAEDPDGHCPRPTKARRRGKASLPRKGPKGSLYCNSFLPLSPLPLLSLTSTYTYIPYHILIFHLPRFRNGFLLLHTLYIHSLPFHLSLRNPRKLQPHSRRSPRQTIRKLRNCRA